MVPAISACAFLLVANCASDSVFCESVCRRASTRCFFMSSATAELGKTFSSMMRHDAQLKPVKL